MARAKKQAARATNRAQDTIAARARETGRRVQQLPDEVIASFAVPDARTRVARLGTIAGETSVGALPVLNWLERHRDAKTAELVFRRLALVTDEAVACADEIDAEDANKAGKGKGALRADWYHDAAEPRPDHFPYGPLASNGRALNVALGGKDDRNFRRLKQRGRRGKVWVVRRDRYAYEVWFSNDGEFRKARDQLASPQKPKKPTVKKARRAAK